MAPQTILKFIGAEAAALIRHQPLAIVGQISNIRALKYKNVPLPEPKVSENFWNQVISCLGPQPTETYHFSNNGVSIGVFSDRYSRHSAPSGAVHIGKLLRSCVTGKDDERILVVCKEQDIVACGTAIARCYPLFSMRNLNRSKPSRTVSIEVAVVGEQTCSTEEIAACMSDVVESVRGAAQIVDKPCNIMNTTAFVDEACDIAQKLKIKPVIIQGEALKLKGMGGIYGVGQGTEKNGEPAMVILSHKPAGATKNIAWVGKGIVYDTGGLSIKGKTTMPGMKRDCGGAAAILYAFYAAVKRGFKQNLHAVLCLAENSVGPKSTRPDDIHVMYSGKTVEINNTDAEGRLVMADGVAYAGKDLKADVILDMATLTGAQGVSTGKYHAALLTNQESWENHCVQAGKTSGDLVHPLVYSPELHFQEFTSAVADMKNSVADRSNAQCSCAGLFVASHLPNMFMFPGAWIHVDMAAPSHSGERATGFGVSLLLTAFANYSSDPLLKSMTPKVEESGEGYYGKRAKME